MCNGYGAAGAYAWSGIAVTGSVDLDVDRPITLRTKPELPEGCQATLIFFLLTISYDADNLAFEQRSSAREALASIYPQTIAIRQGSPRRRPAGIFLVCR
jgi:hypothetical protein